MQEQIVALCLYVKKATIVFFTCEDVVLDTDDPLQLRAVVAPLCVVFAAQEPVSRGPPQFLA